MNFGERILIARKKNNLSALELAEACGVSRSYITLIENGKRLPSRKILLKMAEVLKVKTNIIVNWYMDSVRQSLQ